MNKLLLSLGLLFISSQSIQAQIAKVETGIKAGVNMSNFSGGQSQEFKPGFHVGGFIETPLFSPYKKFSLSFELMYSMQGYKGKEYQQYDDVTWKPTEMLKLDDLTTHNIYVPIVFNYYVNENFGIHVGGQVGYMIEASGEYDINKVNTARGVLNYADNQFDRHLFEQGYLSTDYKDFYEQLDYGIVAGLSFDVSKNITISARYYLGLQDVYKKDNDYKLLSMPSLEGLPAELITPELIQEMEDYIRYQQHLNFDPLKNSVIQVSVAVKL